MSDKDPKFKTFKQNFENYTPLIPEPIIDHILEKSGVEHADKNIKKYLSLVAHKFIADISTSAFQYHKLYQKAALKDKRFAKEKRLTFTMQDLEKAMEEHGINIGRPSYYN